ncbi:glycosyl hydrolase family 2 [Dinghuibacter silviterrae]|uniref:Glycosyl hydrolase family 2 n=2 Tax=Dinghuibacter silviterrae TaxID=1539049 RepID=A0A4R8DFV0_9BACT|nr:glycosyl hydrolase family 2 [Dinghuibacter silviterrae]
MAGGFLWMALPLFAQRAAQQSTSPFTQQELSGPWVCRRASAVGGADSAGAALSRPGTALKGWTPAVVPGTVLTTQLNAGQIPDPFYGMNNERIPDIYTVGNDYYTYWFVRDFAHARPQHGGHIWLQFRGVNYGFDVFLNGHRLTEKTHYGMFLRAAFDITKWLAADGHNRLAVIVYPPDPPGNANGGQGGDGTIARNVTHQYVAGWDWIQPIRDRNTGIWDKVLLKETGPVRIDHPHIVTRVPGTREALGPQAPAYLEVTADLVNASGVSQSGLLSYTLEGKTVSTLVRLGAHDTQTVRLPVDTLRHPRLWWPNGYGAQPLYAIQLRFRAGGAGATPAGSVTPAAGGRAGAVLARGSVSDEAPLTFGVRELTAPWNAHTRSREIRVNGRRVFIKGGNWIVSDAMLRLSKARYDAEVRFHRDMRLNLIRVWGGALTERPEFYDACDRYGLLVMQDFWGSGDCDGRWPDPKKLEDQATRKRYPDDHDLYIRSAADQIRMLRNHPSLAFWCGGNEITPPDDILHALQDSLLPSLDGTRWFTPYSNDSTMSYNTLGGNGDGPYGIQPLETFWEHRTFPFNSEVGSVGLGDMESLERFLPAANRVVPLAGREQDSVWDYHKYIPYGHYPDAYGPATDLAGFTRIAQLLNYDQYRGLIEGFAAHAWDWYTGVIIWKTQNPWTAMRGQMYDYYLDPNACLYGLHQAGETVHAAFNPVEEKLCLTNSGDRRTVRLWAKAYSMEGQETPLLEQKVDMEVDTTLVEADLREAVDRLRAGKGIFLLVGADGVGGAKNAAGGTKGAADAEAPLSRNLYWLPDSTGHYTGLQQLQAAKVDVRIRVTSEGKAEVVLHNPGRIPAFFIRLSVTDNRGHRLLPSFYSDNYISLMPGETGKVKLEFPVSKNGLRNLCLDGWNVKKCYFRGL